MYYGDISQNESDETLAFFVLPDVSGNPWEKANLSNEFGTTGFRFSQNLEYANFITNLQEGNMVHILSQTYLITEPFGQGNIWTFKKTHTFQGTLHLRNIWEEESPLWVYIRDPHIWAHHRLEKKQAAQACFQCPCASAITSFCSLNQTETLLVLTLTPEDRSIASQSSSAEPVSDKGRCASQVAGTSHVLSVIQELYLRSSIAWF